MSPERCNSPAVSVTPARRTPSIEARKTRFLLEAYDLDVRTYLSGAKFLSDSPDVACLIVDYQIFLNQTTSGPDDWDIGYSLTYKSMAALDGLPDKVYELRMKQYGDHSAEQKVIEKRVENAHVVSSMLTRNIKLR